MAGANTSMYIDTTNYCPCGCRQEQLDSYGYCPHLVGFTGRRKQMECLVYDAKGIPRVRGDKIEDIVKGDIIVNPKYEQKDDNGTHMAEKWVSARVYRQCDEEVAEEWRLKYVSARGEIGVESLEPV